MFGLGKKKPEPPQRPTRSRISDGEKEKNKANTIAQLNLFGVPGVGHDSDIDEDDLEGELLALLGENNSPTKKPPVKPRQGINVQQQTTAIDPFSIPDVDVAVDSDDDDIDDADLEAELGQLTLEETSRPQPPLQPEPSNISRESMVNILQDRLTMYQKAKAKSDAIGDTTKSRRFVRGIKTLEDLVKKAKLDKFIDESEIPPIVALGETKPKEEEETIRISQPREEIQTFEPIPQIPRGVSIPRPLIDLDNEPTPISTVPSPIQSPIIIMDPLVEARLKDYKKMAVILKRSGDPQGGLQYLKLAKALEAAVRSGAPVDLSAFPNIPDPSQSSRSEESSSNHERPVPKYEETQLEQSPATTTTENESISNEIFKGPEAPKTIMEALQQRLDKYKSEVEKATSDNNSSKVRRMGRIVKQYEDAIAAYKKGKPIQYDELPSPPGFAPIPVPGSAGGTVAAMGGGIVEVNNSEKPAPVPSTPVQPSQQPMTSGTNSSTIPSSNTNTSPTKPPPSKKSPGGSITRGSKPVVKLTLQEKQLNEILKRQQMFRDAALHAKKLGDINQAKEFLRTAKGFDKLIEASKSGLPVDMNSLPSAPALVAALEAEDFELVSGESVQPEFLGGTVTEIFSKLEQDMKNQLRFCMKTREHYKSTGDIASANRFEKLALESKRDLDTLRLAAKQGDSIPKYRYETRVFNITECNTDLTEDEMEVNILQGNNYKVANPSEIDTFVKTELAYPSPEEAQVNKTAVIKSTNNPQYNTIFKMTITRSSRTFQRYIHSKGIKFEVWIKGRFLKSNTMLGLATVKLQCLETKCTAQDTFEVMDGRKSVGKLEVKIRLRDPVLMKQITQKKENWLLIDRL